MKITGELCEVRWGYFPAARLGKWSAVRNQGETSAAFTAVILEQDEQRMSQAPLFVVVPTESSTWRWKISELQITGSTLTARVS